MKALNFGLLLLAIGIVYLLGNLGLIQMPQPDITSLWPLIPLLGGLNAVLDAISRLVKYRVNTFGSLLNGLFWTAFGAAFLMRNLGVWPGWGFTLRDIFWPLFVIWLGVQIIVKNAGEKNFFAERKKNFTSDMSKNSNFIGELSLVEPWTLTKNSYSIWIGEMYVDVTKAFIPDKDSFLELRALAGEITVSVPKEIALDIRVDVMAGDVTVLDQQDSAGVLRKVRYRSPEWETAAKRLTLDVRMKAGEVTIRSI